MTKPIKTYDAYEIVVIPFPFIDNSNNKKRPALVLSSSFHFNMASGASVLAMITTSKHHSWPLDVNINDLESAGLPAPSIIRMKFFTLDHRLVLKKIGRLHLSDQRSIEKNLKKLFSLA